MTLPVWRRRRTSGGGVLCEIAVHHIDLVRYLLGAEVLDVFRAKPARRERRRDRGSGPEDEQRRDRVERLH